MRLSHADLRLVLDAVGILTADSEPASLAGRTNDAVRRIVSADIISFEGFGTDNDYQGPLWYTPVGSIWDDGFKVLGQLVHEHPCFEDIVGRRIRDAVRVSDYTPVANFRRTALFNEFFRIIGIDRQLAAGLPVSPDLMISVSLCRLKKDFNDRDCSIFDLLTPHLVAAFRNAQFINRSKFESEQMRVGLEATRFGVITVDEHFRLQIESPRAVKLLRKYFQTREDILPEELRRYISQHLPKLRQDEFYLPPQPLEINSSNSKLRINLSFHSVSRVAVLFLEEIAPRSTSSFVGSKLTERETTVLFWIGQGKTDQEIGLILEISARTVQKHVQNIFNKLGVETRTAAMATLFAV